MVTPLRSLIGGTDLDDLARAAEEAPPGAIVEVGVYQGGSAQRLHDVAQRQGRALYLFDTFAGHPEVDPARDDLKEHPLGRFADAIDPDVLRAALPGAVVVVGAFPASLAGLSLPPVAFVHGDADLYGVTRAICTVLPPMMVPGGRLYFDDYSHGGTEGCRLAVDEVFGAAPPLVNGKRLVELPW